MKRIACNVLMLASLVVMLLSCDSNVAKKTLLNMEIKKIQKELPIRLGSIGDMTTVTYEDDVVTLTYLMNENLNDIFGCVGKRELLDNTKYYQYNLTYIHASKWHHGQLSIISYLFESCLI